VLCCVLLCCVLLCCCAVLWMALLWRANPLCWYSYRSSTTRYQIYITILRDNERLPRLRARVVRSSTIRDYASSSHTRTHIRQLRAHLCYAAPGAQPQEPPGKANGAPR
jgi:hypothetical protein